MSVIIYSNNATVLWTLADTPTSSRQKLLSKIAKIQLEGGFTNIAEALEFANTQVFEAEGKKTEITIRHLLTHTSGLPALPKNFWKNRGRSR